MNTNINFIRNCKKNFKLSALKSDIKTFKILVCVNFEILKRKEFFPCFFKKHNQNEKPHEIIKVELAI